MINPNQLAYICGSDKNPIEIRADFVAPNDLGQIYTIIRSKSTRSEKQALAIDVLRNYLEEFEYHEKRQTLAGSMSEMDQLLYAGSSEVGVPIVYRHRQKVVAVAFFHVTWRRNAFLDWMALMPEYFDPDKKLENLSDSVLNGVMMIARQIGAELLFIESKKGYAAKFYRRVLKLKEECDLILLVWDPNPRGLGWTVCPQIYGLANSKEEVRMPK